MFTYNYTAWRFGEFAFDKAPLDEIMEQISMWYVTEISYENEYLKKKRFTVFYRKLYFAKINQWIY